MKVKTFIGDALAISGNAFTYQVSSQLTELAKSTGRVVLQTQDSSFNIDAFSAAGHCTIGHNEGVHCEVMSNWSAPELSISKKKPNSANESSEMTESIVNAWLLIKWKEKETTIEIVKMIVGKSPMYWILAKSKQSGEAFIREVCRFNVQMRAEILVFQGQFQKDAKLMEDIASASFDNLILNGTLKEDIRADLDNFFNSEEIYNIYGVPWKRGLLFVGPPGNGKTHTIKSIINNMQKQYPNRTCIYVKSFYSPFGDQWSISQVFMRARSSAPCILVLEDLDSLLTEQNLSFFLNELDGFASNEGVITIASTNHPEKLDVAILKRPSRFDRKYYFDLPNDNQRISYLNMWSKTLKGGALVDNEHIMRLGEITEGFSYAYLKELFMSSLMRWVSKKVYGENVELGSVLFEQVLILKEQIKNG